MLYVCYIESRNRKQTFEKTDLRENRPSRKQTFEKTDLRHLHGRQSA